MTFEMIQEDILFCKHSFPDQSLSLLWEENIKSSLLLFPEQYFKLILIMSNTILTANVSGWLTVC